MTTARDLIQDAMEKLGVYAPGEAMSDPDASRGLVILDNMLNSWQQEYLYSYQEVETTINLVVNQSAYVIGTATTPTPDIVAQRPMRITQGPGEATATISATDTPVDVVSPLVGSVAAVAGASGTPTILYYEPSLPNGILHVVPIPDNAGTLVFQAWAPLLTFASLDTPDVSLAPAMRETLQCNLAVYMKSYFSDVVVPVAVATMAAVGKDNLSRTNLNSRALYRRGSGTAASAPAVAR